MSANKNNALSVCLLYLLLLSGCDDNRQPMPSHDINLFNKLITLDFPVEKVEWETFGTPEYRGGTPGPTDYVTLVAEVASGDTNAFMALPALNEKIWIAPEAARPWLGREFHAFLNRNKNRTIDAATAPGCRNAKTTLKKSGTPVTGLACQGDNKILLYVTISDSTGHQP